MNITIFKLTVFCSIFAMALHPDAGRAASPLDQTMLPPSELRLSLKDAMEAALDNNPDVRLYKEKIEAARAATSTQLGTLLPNLSASGQATHQTVYLGKFGIAPRRTDPFEVYDARVSMTQSLFSLSLIQKWKASREALKVAELESETKQSDAMGTVGLLYVEALRADALVKSHEANLQLFTELIQLARDRRGSGMGTGLDTARLQAQLENERQQLTTSRYEVERVHLNIINALGLPFEVRLILTDSLKTEVNEMPSIQDAVATALAERMEVKAQSQRVKTASMGLNSTMSERLPSVQAQGDYGKIGNRMDQTVDTYNIGAFLSVPLFDGGQRQGRIQEGRSQVRQEMIRLQNVSNHVTLEVREALVTLASGQEQVAIARAGMQAALTELSLARERFAVLSSSSNLEVTNALFSVSRARENTVDAMFRLNQARINLARALGQLGRVS
ncbi:MAG TPA: TolC family protein [Nitrospiraceae bacterium]|nr:TolC family protein [Nitrospiraceae bacterium]